MIGAVLKAMLVLCLVCSLAACSESTPDRPDRGRINPAPPRTPTTIAAPSAPSETTVVESTVDGTIVRRDKSVLRVDRAEMLRSKEGGDEVFVRATVVGPADYKDCALMKAKNWFAFRDAIESEDPPDDPAAPFINLLPDQKFFGGGTLAVSFREASKPDARASKAPIPTNTPLFAMCFSGHGPGGSVSYDAAHVEGTPRAS